jgi:hypothetical protein
VEAVERPDRHRLDAAGAHVPEHSVEDGAPDLGPGLDLFVQHRLETSGERKLVDILDLIFGRLPVRADAQVEGGPVHYGTSDSSRLVAGFSAHRCAPTEFREPFLHIARLRPEVLRCLILALLFREERLVTQTGEERPQMTPLIHLLDLMRA